MLVTRQTIAIVSRCSCDEEPCEADSRYDAHLHIRSTTHETDFYSLERILQQVYLAARYVSR